MTDTHSLDCFNLSNPGLSEIRTVSNSTWIVCIIQRKQDSRYTSLCIFNDYEGKRIHAEVKFFDYWRKDPKKIFPGLANIDIDKKAFDLVWYTLRSPCDDCVKVVIDNNHMYKSLTIITASVYKYGSGDPKEPTRNRITKLRLNGIKVEPMSPLEHDYFTKNRGHDLPRSPFFSPKKDFLDNYLKISSRAPNLSHLSIKAEIENQFIEEIEKYTSETVVHSRSVKRKSFTLPTPDVTELQPRPTPLPASPSKRTHRREIPPPVQKKTKLECSDDANDDC